MISILDSLSADDLVQKILSLPEADRSEVVARLRVQLAEKVAAQAASDKKKATSARIAAARAGTLGERQAIALLEGALKRGGTSLDAIVAAPETIDAIFAASHLSTDDKFAAKSMLFRLSVIGK